MDNVAAERHRATPSTIRIVPGALPRSAVDVLERALDDAISDGSPRIVVLTGETGRGKTYAIQSFFERLAARYPGYWDHQLAPTWPPRLLAELDQDRKRVVPTVIDQSAEPPFWWFAASGSLVGLTGQDPAPLLAQQLQDQFENALRSAARKKRLTHETLDTLIELILLLVGLLPGGNVAGPIKTALGKAQGFAQAVAADQKTAREVMHDALSQVTNQIGHRPAIAILDDASGASAETLQLISGLTAPDADHVWVGDMFDEAPREERIYFPRTLESPPTIPVLYVVSLWDHRTSPAFCDPIRLWLSEAEELGVQILRVPCTEFTSAEAADLLGDVDGLPRDRLEAVLRHVTRQIGQSKVVNPLTLATVAGTLAEQRAAFGEIVLTNDDVDHLPNVPEQRVKDRIDALKSTVGGIEAQALIHLLCHLGQRVPLSVVRFVADQFPAWDANHILQRIAQHGMFSVAEIPAIQLLPASATGEIDADVYRYLAGERLQEIAKKALRKSCAAGLSWLVEHGLTSGPDARLNGPTVYASYLSLARSLPSGFDNNAELVATALLNQVGTRFPVQPTLASSGALSIAYASGSPWSLTDQTIAAAIDHLGPCWLTTQVLIRRLRSGRQLDTGMADRLEESFRKMAPTDQNTAHALAKYYLSLNRDDDALAVMAPFDYQPQTIGLMARIELSRGNFGAAESLLRKGSSNVHNAITLADLLSERGEFEIAASLLAPFSENAHAIASTAKIRHQQGRDDLAEQVLREALRHSNSPVVAYEYARLLTSRAANQEAIAVLRPYANQPHMARRMVELLERDGDLQTAETILQSAAAHSDTGAIELAMFLNRHDRSEEARASLLSSATQSAGAAVVLAELFESSDDPGAQEAADRWYRTAMDLDPTKALEMSSFLERSGRTEEAIDILREHLHASQDVIVRYANLSIDAGKANEAVERLLTLDSLQRNSAMVVARLLGRTNPEEAADVLRPWMRSEVPIANRMFNWYLIAGRTDKAKSALPNADFAANNTALLLVENEFDQAVSQYRKIPLRSRRSALFSNLLTLSNMGRFDLIHEFLARVNEHLVHEVAASCILSRRDDVVDPERVVDHAIHAVWLNPSDVSQLAPVLKAALREWRLSCIAPRAMESAIQPIGALSMLEVATRLQVPLNTNLRSGVVDELAHLARRDPRLYQAFHTRQGSSVVAREIVRTVVPPTSWRPAEAADGQMALHEQLEHGLEGG